MKVLNVGAQVGLEAIIMGKIIGEEGRMFVVEPYSISYSLLTKNIHLNNLQEIATLYNIAASDKKSFSKL